MSREMVIHVIVSLLVAACLSGAFLYGYYYGKPGNVQYPQSGTASQDPMSEIDSLEKQIAANPQNISAIETLANDYFDLASSLRQNSGNSTETKQYFAKAAENYRKVVSKEPNRVDVETDMATALYYSDQLDQAEAAYQKAISIDPTYLNAHLNYGIFLLYVRNDLPNARKEFTQALNLHPTADTQNKIQQLLAETVTSESTPIPSWGKDIEPVIFQSCAARCHGPGGSASQYPLYTYSTVMKYVTAGDADSVLVKRIKDGHGTKLSEQTIAQIQQWILAGAQNDTNTP